jgi:hypothetical protein
MKEARISGRFWRESRHSNGDTAGTGVARWLGLAAAPTFALMALWTAITSGPPDVFCMAMQQASPFGGMTVMYLLMSAFHLTPWLRLVLR